MKSKQVRKPNERDIDSSDSKRGMVVVLVLVVHVVVVVAVAASKRVENRVQ